MAQKQTIWLVEFERYDAEMKWYSYAGSEVFSNQEKAFERKDEEIEHCEGEDIKRYNPSAKGDGYIFEYKNTLPDDRLLQRVMIQEKEVN